MNREGRALAVDVENAQRRRLDVLRTQLANERTLLAYLRTALALFIVAGSAVKFFESPAIQAVGYGAGVFGVATLAVGTWSYRRTRNVIANDAD